MSCIQIYDEKGPDALSAAVEEDLEEIFPYPVPATNKTDGEEEGEIDSAEGASVEDHIALAWQVGRVVYIGVDHVWVDKFPTPRLVIKLGMGGSGGLLRIYVHFVYVVSYVVKSVHRWWTILTTYCSRWLR